LITSIIFSKDRPLQLDLCLSSIRDLFPQSSHNIVIYNNSHEYNNAYSTVASEHQDVDFWPQFPSLFKDIQVAIESSDNEYICFFTDDCFVYDSIEINPSQFKEIFDWPSLACLSLRLGMNICKRQNGSSYENDSLILVSKVNDFFITQKSVYRYGSYWSYSLSVDGHIYRKKDILEMVDELIYLEKIKKWQQTPNEFEAALQRFWTTSQDIIAFFDRSKVVNSPNNRVQETIENRSGDQYPYCKNHLMQLYLSGYRIKLENLDFSHVNSPHTEIKLI